MENYKEQIDESYEGVKFGECSPENKLQFLSEYIFDFTTYDQRLDEILAQSMLDVCEVIINKTSFDYIQNEAAYHNYILMVNMPFLKDKIEWGTSVRGAWFDEYGHSSETDKTYEIYDFKIPKSEINKFIKELIEWSKS